MYLILGYQRFRPRYSLTFNLCCHFYAPFFFFLCFTRLSVPSPLWLSFLECKMKNGPNALWETEESTKFSLRRFAFLRVNLVLAVWLWFLTSPFGSFPFLCFNFINKYPKVQPQFSFFWRGGWCYSFVLHALFIL